jgi:Type II secretion system (T2SS), protein G
VKASNARRAVLTVALFGLLVATLGYALVVRPMLDQGRQVATCANMRVTREILSRYRARQGLYPPTIAEAVEADELTAASRKFFAAARDSWGHQLHYESRGSAYILVSYGSDGKADGLDYWRVREQAQPRTTGGGCSPPTAADLIASDVAFHTCCGK